MYKSCNGDFRKSIEMDNHQSKHLETEYLDDLDPSAELFRGFEKVPIVLCQRLDITPYLKRKNSLKTDDIIPLTRKTSVVLVRDDLDKLKQVIISQQNNVFKCKICNKTYSSEKKLQNHQENKHIIYKTNEKTPKRVSFSDHIVIHEVKEYHSCRKCPKIFDDYDKLKIHMKRKHKKRKCYVCFYCSKEFVDRTFFKVHVKLHCDACGLLLASKKKYAEHRRYVCRILKKYECKTCNLSFFNYMDLKDHSYDHLGTFFICDICKDQFGCKCEVAHHIQFLHTKKHTNELYSNNVLNSMYTCNFCEMISDDKDVMQKHVGTLPDLKNIATTGYNDYYFCEHCLKKFNTETDMLQHKWTHVLNKLDKKKLIKNNNNVLKTTYRIDEKLPAFLQPKLVLEKLELPKEPDNCLETRLEPDPLERPQDDPIETHFIDSGNLNLTEIPKKAIIDPITKKTLISKHQCEKCSKFLSSRYCLNRHMKTVHGSIKDMTSDFTDLQCGVCEEPFAKPSLLATHRCILINGPEMPFDDARPEIHFDNYIEANQSYLNSMEDDDYMNGDDFEMPAPIVQLTEYEDLDIEVNGRDGQLNIINKSNIAYPLNNDKTINDTGYRLIIQEVPIEF